MCGSSKWSEGTTPQVTEHRSRVDHYFIPDPGADPKPTGKDGFFAARSKYFAWLRRATVRPPGWVLDPVVSVHPDAVMFEVFSQDESSYGRVTVPTSG